jgi:hypothetical protein
VQEYRVHRATTPPVGSRRPPKKTESATPVYKAPARSTLHGDVAIVKDDATGEAILEIEVRGKRGIGYCKSMPGAVRPYERLLRRALPGLSQTDRARRYRREDTIQPPPPAETKYPKPTDPVVPATTSRCSTTC